MLIKTTYFSAKSSTQLEIYVTIHKRMNADSAEDFNKTVFRIKL